MNIRSDILPSWVPDCITLTLGLPIIQAAVAPKTSLTIQKVIAGWRP